MADPITVLIHRPIIPGKEAEFERALTAFYERVSGFPGLLGVHVVRPLGRSREYGLMRTFRDAAARDAFYASPAYREWQEEAARYTRGEVKRDTLTGMEAWFAPPGSHVMVAPPRWKVALATFIGVYPTSVALAWLVAPLLPPWPLALRQALLTLVMVGLLTWLIMPAVRRLLGSFLNG